MTLKIRIRHCWLLPVIPLVIFSCGKSSSGPSSAVRSSTVSGYVFYDENGNGKADPNEVIRLPNVSVSIGGVLGSTAADGRFSLDAVPDGGQSVQIAVSSLPAYFNAEPIRSVSVPSGEVAIPAVLAIGLSARPNLYMAIGDSITFGKGSSDYRGYLPYLADELDHYWGGEATLVNEGVEARRSNQGEAMMGPALARERPAYALILFGTNDFNDHVCRSSPPDCFTVDALRSMIVQTREAGAFPVLGTIPPVNPLWVDHFADERNDWVRQANVLIRQMATQESVAVADVHADFLGQASLPPLFFDDKHPNDDGYRVMAHSFFKAITRPVGSAASARGRVLTLPDGALDGWSLRGNWPSKSSPDSRVTRLNP